MSKQKCPQCKKKGEVRLTGPTAKQPDFPYWVCPRCVDDQNRPKFLTYGTCEDFPAAHAWKKNSRFNSSSPPAKSESKKRKRDESDEEEEKEEKKPVDMITHALILELKPKLDYIIEMMERNWNPMEEKKEAQIDWEKQGFK